MNKFEQVTGDGHRMSLAEDGTQNSDAPLLEGGPKARDKGGGVPELWRGPNASWVMVTEEPSCEEMNKHRFIITTHNEVAARLCFHRCL